MDLVGRRVERAGVQIRLSTTEFDLLAYFMRHRARCSRESEILRAVWGYPDDVDSGVVGVYVGYLRRKLAVGGDPRRSRPCRSVGYRLQANA